MKITDLMYIHCNKNCVILTCRSSLNNYTVQEIKDFSKEKIVICVKDTIYKFHEICDYFIANHHRDQNYFTPLVI